MKKFLKENWFKVAIIALLIWIAIDGFRVRVCYTELTLKSSIGTQILERLNRDCW